MKNVMRHVGRIVTFASIAGVVAAVSAGTVLAQTGAGSSIESSGHAGRHEGLIRRALQLDSLTAAQRASIEALAQQLRTTRAPIRLADAQLLTSLAQQVESGAIDRQALGPALQARESAARSARPAERDAIQKLHDILTPAQRSALVDSVESAAPGVNRDGGGPLRLLDRMAARLGLDPDQRQQIASNLEGERQTHPQSHGGERAAHRQARTGWLESFRSDSFQAAASPPGDGEHEKKAFRVAERVEDLLQAAVPVLTPAQRAEVASRLRARAARESGG